MAEYDMTQYMNFASWVGSQGLGNLHYLSSKEKSRARVEYNTWLAGLEAAPTEETVEEPVTEPVTPTEEVGPGPPTAPTMPEVPPSTVPELTMPPAPVLPPAPAVTPPPEVGAPTVPPIPAVTPAPTIPDVAVTPAPPYKKDPAQIAFEEMYGGKLTDWVEAGGYGIPEETQAQMIQQTTDVLKAREQESLRVMRNTMERRGITNSGFIFANEQQIKSGTSVAIASGIRDVQISSALMKMASFEKAMGQSAQFLGYLSEQSQLAYAPQFATWQAQTNADMIKYSAEINTSIDEWRMTNQFNLAGWEASTQALFAQWDKNSTAMIEEWKMQNQVNITSWQTQAEFDLALFGIESSATLAQWQGQMDIYKMEINQAYNVQNINLAAQIAETAAEQQHIWDVEMAEMEIKYAQESAKAEAGGTISGSIVNGLFALGAAFIGL